MFFTLFAVDLAWMSQKGNKLFFLCFSIADFVSFFLVISLYGLPSGTFKIFIGLAFGVSSTQLAVKHAWTSELTIMTNYQNELLKILHKIPQMNAQCQRAAAAKFFFFLQNVVMDFMFDLNIVNNALMMANKFITFL